MAKHTTRKTGNDARSRTITHRTARANKRLTPVTRAGRARRNTI